MKILCVHGIAGHPPGGDWEQKWQAAIAQALGPGHSVAFCHLDAPFKGFKLTPWKAAKAIATLLSNWIVKGPQPKGWLGDTYEGTAGMVLEWTSEPKIRAATRQLLQQAMATHQPQLVFAHSLGSLVAMDCFLNQETQASAQGCHLVLLGSQAGHDAVRPCFGGKLMVPPKVSRLTQLYNEKDRVFTEPLPLKDPRFVRLDLSFDDDPPLHHDAPQYLRRAAPLAELRKAPAPEPKARAVGAKGGGRAPRRRALLVGINEYLDPNTSPLKGCVNDAWLMSALLQESGFEADEIRMVLNHRATASGLVERLDWLTDGARAGDTCVFYYSGHGAQVPVYGSDGQHVEAVHESLVPHDFDWTRGHAFSDQHFARLYAQLPYELNFLAVFDCCHSGGLTRSGSQRVRGLSPPDDVRHRMLRWDAGREMWLPRDFKEPPGSELAQRLSRSTGGEQVQSTHRMGLAQTLRGVGAEAAMKKLAAQYGHRGPYMPTLLYACEDAQFAYEYEHGPISHGAFTYSLVKRLRAARRKGVTVKFHQLVREVREELQLLGYAQTPHLAAPSHIGAMAVPLSA